MVFRDLLSGILRFFPNAMLMTLLVGGIATERLSWILIAIGGAVIAAVTLTIQYVFAKAFGVGSMPGSAVMEACSMIPLAANSTYSSVPSVWMTMTAFFGTYIAINAAKIYTTTPTRRSKETIPVQQRKGVGLISMLATILLVLFLIIPRMMSPCESTTYIGSFPVNFGSLLGLIIGAAGAYVWWGILEACGSTVLPDIHGVMIGLKPGSLHTAPKICSVAPKNVTSE